jgi:hypothetical protein
MPHRSLLTVRVAQRGALEMEQGQRESAKHALGSAVEPRPPIGVDERAVASAAEAMEQLTRALLLNRSAEIDPRPALRRARRAIPEPILDESAQAPRPRPEPEREHEPSIDKPMATRERRTWISALFEGSDATGDSRPLDLDSPSPAPRHETHPYPADGGSSTADAVHSSLLHEAEGPATPARHRDAAGAFIQLAGREAPPGPAEPTSHAPAPAVVPHVRNESRPEAKVC